jgi:hypothetical protein
MTYYNGNPYAGPTESAPLDQWAHDSCLPAELFEKHTWRDGSVTWQQAWPWHWSPIYGAVRTCAFCGQPTEHEEPPGTWRPLAPGAAA